MNNNSGNLFSEFMQASAPDKLSRFAKSYPPSSFVLSRDKNGNSISMYGDDVWDFTPYRLSTHGNSKLYFTSLLLGEDPDAEKDIVFELKNLMFCLIYHAKSGFTGTLSVAVIISYFDILRQAARFCLSFSKNKIVGTLSLRQLFSTPAYLSAFVKTKQGQSFHRRLPAILQHFSYIGERRIGFKPVSKHEISFLSHIKHQHPVIPTRIYLKILDNLESDLDDAYKNIKKIEEFLPKFSDYYYGLAHVTQERKAVGGKDYHRPDMKEANDAHGLHDFLGKKYKVTSRPQLACAIQKIQWIAKMTIHLYTGMRNEEVNRLLFDCINEEPALGDKDKINNKTRMVSIISTTTKFEGYKREASWFAPEEVLKAVAVLQAICRGLSNLYSLDFKSGPLILSPAGIFLPKQQKERVTSFNKARYKPDWINSLTISANDFMELSESEENRDFKADKDFNIGQPWPLTTHQFRRSLAFYASNSGFVSMPTIKRQFKHLTIQMAQYYANNFENIRTIFGRYNPHTGVIEIPKDHIIFEYQMAIPSDVANQILADTLYNKAILFGKTGSHIERRKKDLDANKIDIREVRAETEKRVSRGELSYQRTLVGGCTKVEACDNFMLGDFAACLTCKESIVIPEKLEDTIGELKLELSGYSEGSGEHQLISQEVDKLEKFTKHIHKRTPN